MSEEDYDALSQEQGQNQFILQREIEIETSTEASNQNIRSLEIESI